MSKEFCIGFDAEQNPLITTWPDRVSDPMGLTYKDVTLLPQHTQITSREEPRFEGDPERVDVTIEFPGLPGKHFPLIISCMDTAVDEKMARVAAEEKCIAAMPRGEKNMEQAVKTCNRLASEGIPFIQAVGLEHAVQDAVTFADNGATVILLDMANSYRDDAAEACRAIREATHGSVEVIGGNVGFGDGVKHLRDKGLVQVVRQGFSMGSACETWVVTRHGSPMLSGVLSAADVEDTSIIADGSIEDPGDLVVALAGGALAGMVGSMVAGTDEAPGEVVFIEGKPYKRWRGQASASYTKDHSGKQQDSRRTAEGVDVYIPYKGSVRPILRRLVAGVVGGCSYSGVHNLRQLREQAIFLRNSQNAVNTGKPHITGKSGTIYAQEYHQRRTIFDMGRTLLWQLQHGKKK